jgi:hypothetical protein
VSATQPLSGPPQARALPASAMVAWGEAVLTLLIGVMLSDGPIG